MCGCERERKRSECEGITSAFFFFFTGVKEQIFMDLEIMANVDVDCIESKYTEII